MSRRKRYNAEQAKKPQQPPKIKHVVSKPRALLKSQKKHGVKKYEQQSKMAIPKEPLDQNVVEPTYKPNFVLKDKPGAETVVDRLLRRLDTGRTGRHEEARRRRKRRGNRDY